MYFSLCLFGFKEAAGIRDQAQVNCKGLKNHRKLETTPSFLENA